MDFQYSISYDATISEVSEMLADADFRVAVCEALEVEDGEVSVEEVERGLEVTVRRVHATDGLAPMAQKFVGDQIEVLQQEVWTAPTHAELSITIPGKPGSLVGAIDLSEAEGVTTYAVSGLLTVSIPFLGAKLEEMVAGLFARAIKVEGIAGAEWLAR